MGYMFGSWTDVHGAGCQRSDRKDGNFTGYNYVYDGYYFGLAPQGDASRMYNYVRLVRDASTTEVTIVSAASVRDHGGTGLALDLTTNGIEPREGGVLKMEFEVSESVASVSASVSCVNNTYAGTATTTPADTTVTVEFDPALPDQDCCEVTLSGDVSGSVFVQTCEGDLNRSGDTTTSDYLQAKIRFGQTVDATNCEWDFNLSGDISTADALQIKIRFGNSAPTCP
jgi:hypothetical protein